MKQAAIFDFDSRIFGKQASWRVQDPRLGYSGSLKNPDWVFRYWQEHQKLKGFNLTDSLSLIDPGFVEASSAEGFTFLPVEHLASTALQHRIRGRSLLLLTVASTAGLENLLRDLVRQTFQNLPGPRSNLPSRRGNPLETAELIECRPVDLAGITSADKLPLARFRRIRSLVAIRDKQEAERPGPFERIFVYTSDPVLAMLIDRFILENQDRFEAGRNALMLSLIANISSDAVMAAQKMNTG
jgi:hypothetical protein